MAQSDTHVFNQDNDYEPVPYSVGIVKEYAGEKLWIPDIPAGEKPAYGMMYHSLEQAYEYYKDYAKRTSFEVRLGTQYKYKDDKDNNADIKYFVCSKEGTNPAPKVEAKSSKKKKRKHPSKRTDCKAAFRVKHIEGRGYWCYEFVEGHNHSLGKHITGAQGLNNVHCLPCGTDYLTVLTIVGYRVAKSVEWQDQVSGDEGEGLQQQIYNGFNDWKDGIPEDVGGIGMKTQVMNGLQLQNVRMELKRFGLNLAQRKPLKIGFKGLLIHRECCIIY
ncbi:FAR1 DNA binding domain, Zinc finger, SWIM-type, MULE transposase domain, FHY3/FAR1 family [Artemisia annua]|uniref:FAR1 DNA binding domain, Zinc finger, SWIM-type, MULE transposase domain, FHY3/FAR1 family n=1 Tax=Artemisia annua TaxID=35608 RepID=A0A2U1LVK7_ARTAN|nr:FAR1 DNA binding domain, Zinc finger, SWIM-type, MULE transposase domain, FHY3/FAR1 family [Artemisia annua]